MDADERDFQWRMNVVGMIELSCGQTFVCMGKGRKGTRERLRTGCGAPIFKFRMEMPLLQLKKIKRGWNKWRN